MKKLLIFIALIFSIFVVSCGGGSNDTNNPTPDAPDTPDPAAEKYYTLNVLDAAEFYYFTASKIIYAYNDGYLKIIHLTATVTQKGFADTTENIAPIDFYMLGDYLNFEVKIKGETKYYEQLNGVMFEVDELWRRPDTMRQLMNNGRFSIEKNTWTTYTVSDIRNLTGNSGICRTLLCQAYYLGKYQTYYEYGLWFCAQDDNLSVVRSGLYFWAESYSGNAYKIIDEPGELWKFN